jgi:signal transduction histidine kinase
MKKIKINTTVDEDLFALADKEMTEFIIRNLLSNAIKFSQRNSEIMVRAFEKDGNVRVEVMDKGIGLSEARIKKLMEMNAGITRRGTEKEKGTGLGLLISKEFIEKNGGQLDIESEPGKGAVFSFSLPLYTAKVFS